ncbi:hypothetical protein ACJZ2D_004176 [Fusarium nematophilum]
MIKQASSLMGINHLLLALSLILSPSLIQAPPHPPPDLLHDPPLGQQPREHNHDVVLALHHHDKVVPHLEPAERLVEQYILDLLRGDEPRRRASEVAPRALARLHAQPPHDEDALAGVAPPAQQPQHGQAARDEDRRRDVLREGGYRRRRAEVRRGDGPQYRGRGGDDERREGEARVDEEEGEDGEEDAGDEEEGVEGRGDGAEGRDGEFGSCGGGAADEEVGGCREHFLRIYSGELKMSVMMCWAWRMDEVVVGFRVRLTVQ